MNILQIHNKVPYPPKDGGSIAVFNLSKGLVKSGCNVDIAALNTNKHFVDIQKIKDELPKKIRLFSYSVNTDIKPQKLLANLFFSKMPYNAERFINTGFEKMLVNLLSETEYDIIQAEGLYMLPYAETIRKYSKAIISFRAHNIEHEIWEKSYKNEKNILKRTYLKLLYKRIKRFEKSYINKYDLLIPITERDGIRFTKLGNIKPIHVSPTGIDIQNYTIKNEENDPFNLFHLGSMDWYPNQEGLIWFLENVWKNLLTQNKSLQFTIAGRNAPESFVKKLKSYENVIYKGEVESAEDFLNSHTIMIIPLLSGSGMRIKIIEGMAYGKVIITTSKGAEGIPAKDNEDILIADNKDQFKEKVMMLTKNPEMIKRISLNAQSFISDNFDNFAISKSLLNFYKKQIKK
jgi:glycosyltransferase involved in cell wall biosynthesis